VVFYRGGNHNIVFEVGRQKYHIFDE
jgi:hypothetical protein